MIKNPKYIYGPTDRYVCASLNFGDHLLEKLRENLGQTAFINGLTDESLTYDEILQDALNIAVSLSRLGVRKGDVVALSSENRREFWSSVIGVIFAGAIVTTVNLLYTKDELKHVLGIAKPKMIICSPFVYKAHEKTYKSLPFLKNVIVFGEDRPKTGYLYNDLTKVNNSNSYLKENVSCDDFLPVENGPNDTAAILYSSGTTGLPKGVMLSHHNLLTICSPSIMIQSDAIGLSITPWFHAMGFVTSLIMISRGGIAVYLPKFEPDLYLRTIEKYKVTQISVVPAIMVALCKSPLQYDTSSLMMVFCGASPLYEETAKAIKKK